MSSPADNRLRALAVIIGLAFCLAVWWALFAWGFSVIGRPG